MLRAATSVVDITPQCEVHLCGYVGEARKHPAQGIHDHPLAVSLLLEMSNARLLFISVDVITMGKSKAEIIKDKIRNFIDIDSDHIIVNAIHSHSLANGFADEAMLGTPDNPEYFHYALEKIAESVRDLEEQLTDVEAYIGTCKVHGYYSKRTDASLPYEDNAAVIKFMHGDRIVAAMCNFNCHATVLGPNNMMLSSDLIGEVRSQLTEELQVVPYTFTGASGDISNRQFRQGNDFAELKRVGKGIADILKGIQNYEPLHMDEVMLQVYDHHIVYDNRAFFDEYQKGLDEANAVLAQDGISLDERKLRTTEVMILKDKMTNETVDFHVSGVVIHAQDLTIVTYPGELASKFGLALRAKCPSKHFLLIGYANDYQGYFIEAEEYGKTYETKASNTPKGESEKIVSEIGDLL